MALPASLSHMTDREAVIDALYRAVTGLDTSDKMLFDSAIAEDAEIDINGKILDREAINAMYASITRMETTHMTSNIRVQIHEGKGEASLTCYVLAQHCRAGEGADAASKKLLAGGMYALKCAKDGVDDLWKVKEWKLNTVWRDGDAGVMSGGLKG